MRSELRQPTRAPEGQMVRSFEHPAMRWSLPSHTNWIALLSSCVLRSPGPSGTSKPPLWVETWAVADARSCPAYSPTRRGLSRQCGVSWVCGATPAGLPGLRAVLRVCDEGEDHEQLPARSL